MSTNTTRDALIETGTQRFLQTGYNHTGIQGVVQAVGVPKGSFYCHFNSKEDFGLQVVAHYFEVHAATLRRYLGDESVSPLRRLHQYFEAYCEHFESSQDWEGCLIGNLSQEMAGQSEAFRLRLKDLFEQWHKGLMDCLKQAQDAGEIPPHLDVQAVAEFCLNSWEGALLRMKVTKNTAPLRTFMTILFESVLKG